MVVTATVGATAHRYHPSWLRHLIVYLAERRCHLVGKSTGHNHNIRLAGRGTENDTEAILVVAWGGEMHHFDGTAGETEGHRPKGGLASPVRYLIEGCTRLVLV